MFYVFSPDKEVQRMGMPRHDVVVVVVFFSLFFNDSYIWSYMFLQNCHQFQGTETFKFKLCPTLRMNET